VIVFPAGGKEDLDDATRLAIRWLCVLGVILELAWPAALDAKGSWKGASTKTSSTKTAKTPRAPRPVVAQTGRASVLRDAKGRIQRSDATQHAFARQTGCPNGRPGYVIDHIAPLACRSADGPSNVQRQTVAAAKAKTRSKGPAPGDRAEFLQHRECGSYVIPTRVVSYVSSSPVTDHL
jgi:hypothetical protein